MKRKHLLTIAIVLAVILAALGGTILLLHQEAPAEETTVPTTEVPEAAQTTTQPETIPTASTETTVPPAVETVPMVTVTTEPTEATMEQTEETIPEETIPEETIPEETVPEETVPEETGVIFVSLPYTIPFTDLVVEDVRSYDGIFLEDGSDEPITAVAALIIRNAGSDNIDYAKFHLAGAEKAFSFELTGLEAGATAVVMEKDRQSFTDQIYSDITAETAMTEAFELSEGILKIEETEDGQLLITNISDADIPCARIFYKFYLEEENLYVGGIAYTVKLLDLKAGTSATVAPSHYVAGQSKIIMAKIYESDGQ